MAYRRIGPYVPTGAAARALEAMRAQPEKRIWRTAELKEAAEVRGSDLFATLTYVMRNGLVFRRKSPRGHGAEWSLQPFEADTPSPVKEKPVEVIPPPWKPENDCRVPSLDSWTPPKMTAPRAGSEYTSLRRPAC